MASTRSWSRYGSQRRLCARAGCNAAAVATLRFQPTERRAWLAELDESAARTQGDLCQRHAAALVLPRGWELHDERTPVASGDASPAPEPIDVAPAPRDESPGAEGETQTEQPEPPPADDQGNGARPVLGTDDEAVEEALDSILDARTPLLQRAFRNARPAS